MLQRKDWSENFGLANQNGSQQRRNETNLVSFNKKRDRKVSGAKRKHMILQRRLGLQRSERADYELFRLTEVEMMFAKYYTLLRLPGKGGKFVPSLIPPKIL